MTDLLLSLVVDYGAALLFVVTFLSCLAIPMPSSLLMLAGGGFVASGDLAMTTAAGAAYLGAVSGDQAGFHIGRTAGHWLERKMTTQAKRAALHKKAVNLTNRFGGLGVFLSRWLISPLGPYVNFAGGATGIHWLRFTVWGMMGEAVWVTVYVGLGYTFADRITELAEILGNASGFLAAGAVTVGLGLWLRSAMKQTLNNRGD